MRILLQLLGEQIRHQAVVADRTIVSGNTGASQERRALRPPLLSLPPPSRLPPRQPGPVASSSRSSCPRSVPTR